jgi:hypothetical protein
MLASPHLKDFLARFCGFSDVVVSRTCVRLFVQLCSAKSAIRAQTRDEALALEAEQADRSCYFSRPEKR